MTISWKKDKYIYSPKYKWDYNFFNSLYEMLIMQVNKKQEFYL